MPVLTVSALDLAILMAYVIGSRLIFGWCIARKRRQGDTEAYFLGGRNIHWAFIGLSFYVSNMSGSTFVGLPGSGYLNGIAVYHYEWLPDKRPDIFFYWSARAGELKVVAFIEILMPKTVWEWAAE